MSCVLNFSICVGNVALLMVRKSEQQSRYRKPETAKMVDALTLESFRRWSYLSQKYH